MIEPADDAEEIEYVEESRPVRTAKSSRSSNSSRSANSSRSTKPAKSSKKKKRRTLRTVLIVIAVLVLALAAAVVGIFMHFYGLMNTDTTPSPTPEVLQTPDNSTPEPTEEPTPTPRPLTEEEQRELEEMQLRSSLQEDAEEIMYSEDVYNILLVGADGTSQIFERSDAMILLSINKQSKTMWLTSFMRDTEVSIMNADGSFYGTGHLNWATSYGGIDMLIATIESEKNFAIHIDNWAMVNFLDFADVADMLGPITVSVSAQEAVNMNTLIRQVCQLYDAYRGLDENGDGRYRYFFPDEGVTDYEINDGIQILGYCRERKVNGDTGRSAHQRDALMQMWGNVRKMNLMQQYQLAEKVMSIITTNMTRGQCLSLLLNAPAMLTYDIKTQQCPTPGAFWKGRDANNLSIYNMDFRVNRNFLRATIYDDDLTTAELTSTWTGNSVLVWDPVTDTVP